jgi:dUTP pyrophosphatase
MNEKVRIKRVDKSLPLPEYKTAGAAGFDLAARVTTTLLPHVVGYVPLNVVIEPPEGYYVALVPRSSLHKRGLMPANGFGVGDRDFCGNGDEYNAALLNFTEEPVVIERGDRIMQVVISPVVHATFIEVDDMGHDDRGAFGTTGNK